VSSSLNITGLEQYGVTPLSLVDIENVATIALLPKLKTLLIRSSTPNTRASWPTPATDFRCRCNMRNRREGSYSTNECVALVHVSCSNLCWSNMIGWVPLPCNCWSDTYLNWKLVEVEVKSLYKGQIWTTSIIDIQASQINSIHILKKQTLTTIQSPPTTMLFVLLAGLVGLVAAAPVEEKFMCPPPYIWSRALFEPTVLNDDK
jgi:hypothetical protein